MGRPKMPLKQWLVSCLADGRNTMSLPWLLTPTTTWPWTLRTALSRKFSPPIGARPSNQTEDSQIKGYKCDALHFSLKFSNEFAAPESGRIGHSASEGSEADGALEEESQIPCAIQAFESLFHTIPDEHFGRSPQNHGHLLALQWHRSFKLYH